MSAIPVESLARFVRATRLALALALGAAIGGTPAITHAQPTDTAVQRALQSMETAAGAAVDMTWSPVTGLATFVATKSGRAIPTFAAPNDSAEARGRLFLERYGEAFGISAPDQVQQERVIGPDAVGMEHVRFRQVYKGIKIRGGEIIIHLRAADAKSVTAKTLAGIDGLNTVPTITAAQALAAAQQVLLKHLNVSGAVLSTPTLEIFNRGLLDGSASPTRLAWFIEARKADVREWIWVDAQRGAILLHFNQIADAKVRAVHSANNGSILPGTLVRSEGGAATADNDVNNAYEFSGDTYDYFFSQHGRDSFDGAGGKLTSTVHYCPDSAHCPYANAFWNGIQVAYGDGYAAADDIDAHELTHAVTERSAGLVYFMQSGALNESFSDIFGETVDLSNAPHGTDTTAVRWLIGEDLPSGGAIRNMMNPNAFDDPAKVSDLRFICNTPGIDNGGVHFNSGVPNHAYALMVDGGTYNGQIISGIGLVKAGKIQYRALTQYLVSTADFQAAYSAIQQACTDLVGTAGIAAADCANVKKALDSVEMNSNTCSPVDVPALCPTGQTPTYAFSDDLENLVSGNWTTTTASGVNHWNGGYGTPNVYWPNFPASGSYSFWGFDYEKAGDSSVAMTTSVAIPSGNLHMQFNHVFNFDHFGASYYDGGVLEYSANGGSTWIDAGSLISAGANYGGAIVSGFSNPLAARNAFVGGSGGYTASQLNLSSLAGKSIRLRFRVGTDSTVGDLGWLIDDVRIYACAGAATALTLASSPNPSTFGQPVNLTATVSPAAATGTVTFKEGTVTLGATLSGGTATVSTATLAVGSHSITAAYAGDTNYKGSSSPPLTQTVNKGNCTTTLVSSLNPSTFGQPVNFTATVSPAAATGTVTFKEGTTNLGTATLSGGTARLSTTTLAVGSHSITAVYVGDTNCNGSTSAGLVQTVNKGNTTTTLASSLNPSTFGQPVNLTATVSPAAATGTVTFKEGSVTLGTAMLTSGTATFSTATLTVGSHSITAVYGGDANYNGATSPVITQTVNKANSTTTVVSDLNPAAAGRLVTFTARVLPAGAGGTVIFKDGTVTLGTAPLSGGSAVYSTATLAIGSHSITAVYSGDANTNGSTSAVLAQTVIKDDIAAWLPAVLSLVLN